MAAISPTSIESSIVREYARRGDVLSWRFLYSPASVLRGARVAFVGTNPGGNEVREDHAVFAMKRGSAYALEDWYAPPGTSKLQREVLALFARLGERPEDVLAGNLVPFRSPSWAELKDKSGAIAFGRQLWEAVLAAAQPSVVIAMGDIVRAELRHMLGVRNILDIPVNWGNVQGERGTFGSGRTFVGLPHLSRFAIVSRPESQRALSQLLRGCAR